MRDAFEPVGFLDVVFLSHARTPRRARRSLCRRAPAPGRRPRSPRPPRPPDPVRVDHDAALGFAPARWPGRPAAASGGRPAPRFRTGRRSPARAARTPGQGPARAGRSRMRVRSGFVSPTDDALQRLDDPRDPARLPRPGRPGWSSAKRSQITQSPRASAGRIVAARWSARAAENSSASATGPKRAAVAGQDQGADVLGAGRAAGLARGQRRDARARRDGPRAGGAGWISPPPRRPPA